MSKVGKGNYMLDTDNNIWAVLNSEGEKALAALVTAGADQAVVSLHKSIMTELNVDFGKPSLYRTVFGDEARLTAIVDGKKGVITTNQISETGLKKAAKDCLTAAAAAQPDKAWQLAPSLGKVEFEPEGSALDEDKMFLRCQELLTQISDQFPLIMIEQMVVSHVDVKSLKLFSSGTRVQRTSGYYVFYLIYNAQDGEKTSSFNVSFFQLDNLDQPLLEYGNLRDNLAFTERQIETKPLAEQFTGTVLMAPSPATNLLGMAFDNFVSDTAIMNKTSIWLDKLESRVADEKLTVRIAPLDSKIIADERITAEGYLSEDYTLIDKGVLKSFMLSDYAARKSGQDRVGNGSEAMVIAGGTTPLAELIAGIEKGVFLWRFSGGQPSINGDFSGVAKNSFLIENGKITTALRETMLSGNIDKMLREIRGISAETVSTGNYSAPYIAVDGIIISG